MGREVRRVPLDWKHPTRYDVGYRGRGDESTFHPVYDRSFEEATRTWRDAYAYYYSDECNNVSMLESRVRGDEFWEYYGNPPAREYYRRSFEGLDREEFGYQIYETVSEGTPVSPVFKTKEEMVEWIETEYPSNRLSKDLIERGSAPSGYSGPGIGFIGWS